MKAEQIMQIQVIEQEANQFNEQLQIFDQNISEMQELNKSLDEIENSENNEILANLGKKIYLPAEIKKNQKLMVEVGNKNYVKKSISETKEIVDDQLKKLIIAKQEIMDNLETLQNQMLKLIEEIEKEQEKEEKGKKD